MNKKWPLVAGILLLCVICGAMQYTAPAYSSDDSSDEVTVTATVGPSESYGARVVASSRWVFLPWRALGEPNGRGAWMFHRGWISIELENMVTDCSTISIWSAKRGRGAPYSSVYISSDGSTWTHIGGGKCTSTSYTRYDFSGAFGDVKYVKVKRNWVAPRSVLLLDAVMAKR